MVGEIAGVQTAVQDFRNKYLPQLEQGVPGGRANPAGGFQAFEPGLPASLGSGGRYAERQLEAGAQALSSHARLQGAIQQRAQRARQLAGQGMTAASTRAIGALGGGTAPKGAAGGWGGAYGLQKNAAAALARMSAAYQARWGVGLVVNSGGRSYAEQAAAYAAYKAGRGNLAAPPGTSVHESGRAVDLGGAILNASSAQHQWLQQNAGQYGFVWTGRTFKQFEPWHWEYHGS